MKNSSTEVFESIPVPAAVRTMAIPMIMGQLITLIYNMADTFFIGKINDPDMVAAASLILPVFNFSLSIAGLAGIGGGSLISRLLGRKNEAEAEKVSNFSIWFSICIAGLFSVLVYVFMRPLLSALGANEDTFGFASSYAFCVIVLGGIPTVMTNVLSNLVRSIGESKHAGIGVMTGGIINIGLDPLFMFVIFPKGQEIIGAGTATLLSNIISCVYFIIVIKRLGDDSVIKLRTPAYLPSRESIKSIFSVGIPSSVVTFLFDLDYVVLDRLMAGYGNTALAAIGIVLKAERLPLNVGLGICHGMVPLTAYNYSSGNYKRMREIADYSRTLGIVIAVISICLYEIFSPWIMRFFIADAGTVTLGADFLRVRTIATLFMFMSFFHVHLFNSFGLGRKALFLGLMRWAVFNIPMLFLFNKLFGMYGLVWSQTAADIITVIMSFRVYMNFLRTVPFGQRT